MCVCACVHGCVMEVVYWLLRCVQAERGKQLWAAVLRYEPFFPHALLCGWSSGLRTECN